MLWCSAWEPTWPLAKVLEVAHTQSSRSCTYTRFLFQGVEIELIFTLWAAVSKIWADFQNWVWNLAIGQSSRSCTYTLFLPQGGEIELIFTLWAAVSKIWGDFQNCHLDMKLDKWPKFQKLHLYPLSAPRGRNWAYFHSTGSSFRDMGRFSKLPFGHETLPLPKFPEVTHTGLLHFYLKGLKFSFRSTGGGFRDTGQFSKLPYLGMNLDKWPKFQKLHIYSVSPIFHSVLFYGWPFQDIGNFPFSHWSQC